jgi:hypothetical protein
MLMKKYAEAIPYMQRSLAVVPTYAPGHQMIGQAHLLLGQPELARSTQIAAADKFPTPAAKVGPLVAGALMYVPMGKPRDAIAELVTLAASFEQQNLRGQASAAHANAALVEAAFGNRKAVAGHLAKSRAVTPPPGANATPASQAQPIRIRTLTFAMTGQADSAKASAVQFAQAVAEGSPVQRNNSRELNGIVAIGEKNFDLAREELAQAGPGATLGRAMLAEALKKSGRKAEATALKAEVLNRNPVLNVFDVIARAKAQKI